MKPTLWILLFVTMVVLGFTGCDNSNTPTSDTQKSDIGSFDITAVRNIIEEKNSQFTQAHVNGDSTTIDNMFTEDARSFPPNTNIVVGKATISALTADYLKSGVKQFTEETTSLYGNKDYLVDEGTYSMVYGKDNTSEKGKYLNVWKNVNGEWKLYSNIWNTNAPENPAK